MAQQNRLETVPVLADKSIQSFRLGRRFFQLI